MFDNVAFNVVIGLVFIYLLYSLLVTTVGELLSTKLGVRARLLRIAIERMFNDGYLQKIEKAKNKWAQGWLRKNFLYEADEFKKSFAGLFYEYPAIKYLSRIEDHHKGMFSSTKPSYFSADYFADTLINFLSDKGTGASTMDKIAFCLKFNTYHIQPKTLKQFNTLFESAEGNEELYKKNIIKWFNETMDRANGWHKRKMRTISFWMALVIAASFNVDSIRIAKTLANDKEARNQLVNMGVALSRDSATKYKDYVNKNGDTLHSSSIIDTGFVRVTKDIDAANAILGIGWGFTDSLKSDNMSFDSKDSANVLLQKSVKSLDEILSKKKDAITSLTDSASKLARYKKSLDSLHNDTIILRNKGRLYQNSPAHFRDSMRTVFGDQTKADTNGINNINAGINIILAQMRNDSGSLAANDVLSKIIYTTINEIVGKKYVRIDSISASNKENTRIIYGKSRYSLGEKLAFIFSHILWYNLIGFVITAFALSLGAPFWFDLLNKFVSIRGVGVKPEEKKVSPVKAAEDDPAKKNATDQKKEAGQPEPVGDVVEAALREYAIKIKSIPGVKSVFTVVKNGIKQVQINVDNLITQAEVSKQFPQLVINTVPVPSSVVVSGTPSSHQGAEGVISNKSGKNGFGSLGCVLLRKDTGSRHILSCWHVLKGDFDYSASDNEPVILDHASGEELADRWAGGIRDQFDYGLAICRPKIIFDHNLQLKRKLNLDDNFKIEARFVPKADIGSQIPVKYYDCLNDRIVNGIIFTNSDGVDINYVDKTRTIQDVLVLTDENETTITAEGNSGSIVFDGKNRAIAMIIGGDLKYSYAVKLSHIFNIHKEMTIA